MVEIKCQIGPAMVITVQGDGPKDAIEAVAFFNGLPATCPMCGSGVHFYHHFRQSFNFYGMECDRFHQTQFGQNKTGGTLFYKGPRSWQDRPRQIEGEVAPDDEDPFADAPQGTPANKAQRPVQAQEEPTTGYSNPPVGTPIYEGPELCPGCSAPTGKPHARHCRRVGQNVAV